MQLTITLPDMLPHEKLNAFIREIEQVFRREGLSCEIQPSSSHEQDAWDQLDIERIAIDTGISDFAYQHDHYLYGTPKRS
jgi:hypothetical protein